MFRPTTPRSGTARAALRHRDFRTLWIGSFLSNVGTWMQNVLLPVFAYKLAEQEGGIPPATFAGLIILAQLAPLLLSPLGGVIGDRLPRRPFLISCQVVQLGFSVVLAWLAVGDPSKLALFGAALGVGIGNALNAPAWAALMPTLVPRADLPGAISLNSTMINGSRVIGPLIVVVLKDSLGMSTASVFLLNALTYLFVIVALLRISIPAAPADQTAEPFMQRLTAGLEEAREQPVIGRILLVLATFSFVCLPYVGQFQTIAERNLQLDSDSATYRWLYATWGLGACLGGLAIGTVLARYDKRRIPRVTLIGFGVALAAFALTRSVAVAFAIGFVLGFCYFATTTSMLTVVQQHVDERVRARVMALWFVAFGGTVPFGSLAGGWAMDHWNVTGVLLVGSLTAFALAQAADFVRLSEAAPATRLQLASS